MLQYQITEILLSLLCCVLICLYRYTRISEPTKSQASQKPLKLTFCRSPLPILGHALCFLRGRSLDCIQEATQNHATKGLVGINVGLFSVCIVSGAETIRSLFQHENRRTASIVTRRSTIHAVKHVFGCPQNAIDLYDKDNSGVHREPDPRSNVVSDQRIFHHTTRITAESLGGAGLSQLGTEYLGNLREIVQTIPIEEEWVDHEDLADFLKFPTLLAATNAVCGPDLVRQSPSFVEHFWHFDEAVATLAKGIPWFLAPKAWLARQRCLNDIREWHKSVYPRKPPTSSPSIEFEPVFGSQYIRRRHKMLHTANPHIQTALPSLDLGAIWASNANTIPAIVWALFHVLDSEDLLAFVRREIALCQLNAAHDPLDFDVSKLLQQPLLQSIFAEVLRLYTALFIIRETRDPHLHFQSHLLDHSTPICISSWHAQRDPGEWHALTNDNQYPVDSFWAQRFLRPTTNPATGRQELQFSLKGLTGRWVPFGGGSRVCPGRHFAKQEIILSMAVFLTEFDIEIDKRGRDVLRAEPEMGRGGTGVLPPKHKIPIRIRRRRSG